MLDQTTDRMWYMIGAILLGAAIIGGFMIFMPEAFASVGGMFDDFMGNVNMGVVPNRSVSVIYDVDGDTDLIVVEEEIFVGDEYVILDDIPTKEGFDFVQWRYDGETYTAGDTIIIEDDMDDIVFTAEWDEMALVRLYTESYLAYGSFVKDSSEYVDTYLSNGSDFVFDMNEDYRPTVRISNNHYTPDIGESVSFYRSSTYGKFIGWREVDDPTGRIYTQGDVYPDVTSEVMFEPVVEAYDAYGVTAYGTQRFDVDGGKVGSGGSPTYYIPNSNYTLSSSVAVEVHRVSGTFARINAGERHELIDGVFVTFIGWKDDDTGVIYNPGDIIEVDRESIDFYPVFDVESN